MTALFGVSRCADPPGRVTFARLFCYKPFAPNGAGVLNKGLLHKRYSPNEIELNFVLLVCFILDVR